MHLCHNIYRTENNETDRIAQKQFCPLFLTLHISLWRHTCFPLKILSKERLIGKIKHITHLLYRIFITFQQCFCFKYYIIGNPLTGKSYIYYFSAMLLLQVLHNRKSTHRQVFLYYLRKIFWRNT